MEFGLERYFISTHSSSMHVHAGIYRRLAYLVLIMLIRSPSRSCLVLLCMLFRLQFAKNKLWLVMFPDFDISAASLVDTGDFVGDFVFLTDANE